MSDSLKKIEEYLEKLIVEDTSNKTEDDYTKSIQEGVSLIEEILASAKQPTRSYRDIIRDEAAKVNTSGVKIPGSVRVAIERDLTTTKRMLEHQTITREKYASVAKNVVKILAVVAKMASPLP